MKYVPILRLRTVETKILHGTSHTDVFPLLEVVDKKMFGNLNRIGSRFPNGVMVELPLYLTDTENKYFGGVSAILRELDGDDASTRQIEFYKQNTGHIKIPVISSSSSKLISYKSLVDGLKDLKQHYEKIAVRIFINSVDISQTNMKHLQDLMQLLRNEDIVLLDVVEFDGLESEVMRNITKAIALIPENKLTNTVLLNAFDVTPDWKSDVHHYGPLLAKMFNLFGFGDFSTMPRYESGGGSNVTTSVIRYFSPYDIKLIHFATSTSFLDTKRKLKGSEIWRASKSNGHFKTCDSCQEIDTKDSEWKTFWKVFRINHHLNSAVTDVLPATAKFRNIQDFDIEGYNNLFKKTNQTN